MQAVQSIGLVGGIPLSRYLLIKDVFEQLIRDRVCAPDTWAGK